MHVRDLTLLPDHFRYSRHSESDSERYIREGDARNPNLPRLTFLSLCNYLTDAKPTSGFRRVPAPLRAPTQLQGDKLNRAKEEGSSFIPKLSIVMMAIATSEPLLCSFGNRRWPIERNLKLHPTPRFALLMP